MKTDTQTFYCSIKTELMRKTLFKGSMIAGLGGIFILFGGVFFDEKSLSSWGLPLFFLAMGLIAAGMIPYRRLTRLEKNPHLVVVNERELVFFKQGKKTFTIPLESIDSISYCHSGDLYGIGIVIKKNPQKKVIIHSRLFDRKRFGCDLFLPYFSERSCREISTHLD